MKWLCWFGLHNYQPENHTAGNGRMFYVYRCIECERMFLFDPFRAARLEGAGLGRFLTPELVAEIVTTTIQNIGEPK